MNCSRCGRAREDVAWSYRLDAAVCFGCYLSDAPTSRVSEDDLDVAREARGQGGDLEQFGGAAALIGRRLRGVALDLDLATGEPAALRGQAGRLRAEAIKALKGAA